ncbi:hypothetical protein [Devosia chinhatensis]|nr:hypothetical protein [Devosia chinhatensis]
MIENSWTHQLRQHHAGAANELDQRAIALCDAWITWADGFGIAPPAELAAQLKSAKTESACVIVRQITRKLAKECPVTMPMQSPTSDLFDASAGPSMFDLGKGPSP